MNKKALRSSLNIAITAGAISLGLLQHTPTASAQSGAEIRIYSFEEMSCGKWAKHREGKGDDQIDLVFLSWIRGFISGNNYRNPMHQINKLPDKESISLFIDKYCRENPLHDWTSAVPVLAKELTPIEADASTPKKKKKEAKKKTVTPHVPEGFVLDTPETLNQ